MICGLNSQELYSVAEKSEVRLTDGRQKEKLLNNMTKLKTMDIKKNFKDKKRYQH